MASRWLHLLRHAKSAWDTPGLADHDRPLAPRGWNACRSLEAHLRAAGVAPDLVLCSSALRAQQTLAGIRDGLPGDVEVEVGEELYGAGAPALLSRLRQVPDGVASVLLVAHNPGIGALATGLAGDGDDEPTQRLASSGYPTAALASFSFTGAWAVLDWAGPRLGAFVIPADLG